MYEYLDNKGILEQTAFRYYAEGDTIEFALDVKALEPYRESMLKSKVPDARFAVEKIFNSNYTPCPCCGTISVLYPTSGNYCNKCWRFPSFSKENIEVFRTENGIESTVKRLWPQPTAPEVHRIFCADLDAAEKALESAGIKFDIDSGGRIMTTEVRETTEALDAAEIDYEEV